MSDVLYYFIQSLFIITFIFVYIIAFVLIKPFTINKKRPLSTLSLKISYLFYLLSLLVFFFLLIFYQADTADDDMLLFNSNIHWLVLTLPSLGIFVRRLMEKIRIAYNYFFSAVNMLSLIILLRYIFSYPWTFFD